MPPLTAAQAQTIVETTVAALPPPQGVEKALRGEGMCWQDAAQIVVMQEPGVHHATTQLAGLFAAIGYPMEAAIIMIENYFVYSPPLLRDERWADRLADVRRTTGDIYRKAARDPKASRRSGTRSKTSAQCRVATGTTR